MRKFLFLAALTAMVTLFLSFENPRITSRQYLQDSLEKDRAKYVALVSEMIRGKEKLPVDSVFKNLKLLKGFPAENLVRIMDKGWSRALGVSCGHCHNTADFALDEKTEKSVARSMVGLTQVINREVKSINGIKSKNPTVNCTTCHRGQTKPALNL